MSPTRRRRSSSVRSTRTCSARWPTERGLRRACAGGLGRACELAKSLLARLRSCEQSAKLLTATTVRIQGAQSMATSSKKTTTAAVPDCDPVTENVRDANERLAEVGRKVSSAYLDAVEKYADGIVQFERKIAEQSPIEPVANMFETHAKLTEEVVKASVEGARELIAV